MRNNYTPTRIIELVPACFRSCPKQGGINWLSGPQVYALKNMKVVIDERLNERGRNIRFPKTAGSECFEHF